MNQQSAQSGPQAAYRVDSSLLWKVTLGFLPFYVNLQKRLHPEKEGTESKEAEVASSSALESIRECVQFSNEDVPDAETISECSMGSGWTLGSANSVASHPSDEASSKGVDARTGDPDLVSMTSKKSYSDSFYDFARPASMNKRKKYKGPTNWMVEFFSESMYGVRPTDDTHTV